MINGINSQTSFKGYVPVKHYALNPRDNQYWRVTKKDNLRKCQGFVVRNLNGTAKNMHNSEFVRLYASHDNDYRRCPVVHSVYDLESPDIYMVTGWDVDNIQNMAKKVGVAKSESISRIGNTKSFEVKDTANSFFKEVKNYINNFCRQLRSDSKDNLELRVFFVPQYKKDGTLKGFTYNHAEFANETENSGYVYNK